MVRMPLSAFGDGRCNVKNWGQLERETAWAVGSCFFDPGPLTTHGAIPHLSIAGEYQHQEAWPILRRHFDSPRLGSYSSSLRKGCA